MFVNIIYFPPVKEGKDAEFRAWFARSSQQYAVFPGFIRRRLLVPHGGGTYAAIVEHESYDSFMAMHTSTVRAKLHEQVVPLFDGGSPEPGFYDVAML